MAQATLINPTEAVVQFHIDGYPGRPPTQYSVGPGETCEVPAGYVASGLIRVIAPGLVRAPDPDVRPEREKLVDRMIVVEKRTPEEQAKLDAAISELVEANEPAPPPKPKKRKGK